jgi:hypothetical protein
MAPPQNDVAKKKKILEEKLENEVSQWIIVVRHCYLGKLQMTQSNFLAMVKQYTTNCRKPICTKKNCQQNIKSEKI